MKDLLGNNFKVKKGKIMVTIASYRDPELVPTIKDLISKANNPDNLRICIAWQHSPEDKWDNLDEFKSDSRFHILDIKANSSHGVCWARSLFNELYKGEEYTLQLDSHHRFVEGWDTILIDMYQSLKKESDRPLLTSYLASYDPKNEDDKEAKAFSMKFDTWAPEGTVLFRSDTMERILGLNKPLKARFLSGHFIFTDGEFVRNVPYDPQLYFHGEEITMAVRAFTHGYDLYHPHIPVAFHEYIREGRVKHCDDHEKWHELNGHALDRMKKILGIDNIQCSPCMKKSLGDYYIGNERSIREYEEYAGIVFKNRSVTQYTQENLPPPNPPFEYEKDFKQRYIWNITFDADRLEGITDYDLWAVILQNEYGHEIHRQDFDKDTLNLIISKEGQKEINLNGAYMGNEPHTKWIIWPHKDGKWLKQIKSNEN